MYSELVRRLMRKCRICNVEKSLDQFYLNGFRRKDGTSGRRWDCKSCKDKLTRDYARHPRNRPRINMKERLKYRGQDKTRWIEASYRKLYGITIKDFDEMLKSQDGKCAICGVTQKESPRRFDVDHCHETGKIRGLCCIRCNRGIGLLRDNPAVLRKAAEYIERARARG